MKKKIKQLLDLDFILRCGLHLDGCGYFAIFQPRSDTLTKGTYDEAGHGLTLKRAIKDAIRITNRNINA